MTWSARTTSPSFLTAVRFRARSLCTVLALALTPVAQRESGLIGHWKLDEDVATDSSPNELHGRFSAVAAEHSVGGKVGKGIRLPAGSPIRLDRHASTLGKLTDFTVSMWIQYDGGASRQLFSFSNGTLSHRIQAEVHNGALGFGWQDGGSFQNFMTKPLSWEWGRWYHVVFVNHGKVQHHEFRA